MELLLLMQVSALMASSGFTLMTNDETHSKQKHMFRVIFKFLKPLIAAKLFRRIFSRKSGCLLAILIPLAGVACDGLTDAGEHDDAELEGREMHQ